MTKTEEEGTSQSNGHKDLRDGMCVFSFEEGNALGGDVVDK